MIKRIMDDTECFLEFIQGFEQGFETVIGENGIKLSGGEQGEDICYGYSQRNIGDAVQQGDRMGGDCKNPSRVS